MKLIHFRFVLIFPILFSVFNLSGFSNIAPFPRLQQSNIVENSIKAELIFSLGSDKENEDFYDPRSFAIDSEGRIFVLDTKNSRVQCFSPGRKFLFSFGRFGRGPGELSKQARKIKILEDGNIYIIDELFHNLNAYDGNGKYLYSWKTTDNFNDIELVDEKYYLSNCYLREDNKPILISNKSGNIEGSFGLIIEPEAGILKKIVKEKDEGLYSFFNNAAFSSISRNKKKELFYSLKTPYRLIKYDTAGRILKDVVGNIDFGDKELFPIVYTENIPFIKANFPLPIIFPPCIKSDDTIIIPFMKKERDYLFFDLYDQYSTFIKRYKILEQLTVEKYESIVQIYVDDENNLFCLKVSREKPAKIEKYKLIFD